MLRSLPVSTTMARKPWGENNSEKHTNELRVIGAGLPRTGTTSMKAALQILGFSPCHHMLDTLEKPDRIVEFTRAYDGEKIDFHEIMQGYRSTVDSPTTDFYKEIHQVYPMAKIILTVRDTGEKWFDSFQNTIGPMAASNFYYFATYLLRPCRLQVIMVRKILKKWSNDYGPIGPSVHDRHNRRVIDENKDGDILVYNVKEGWPPLCQFLGVDIPQNVPFPNVNDTEQFKLKINSFKTKGLFYWTAIGILFVLSTYIVMRIT